MLVAPAILGKTQDALDNGIWYMVSAQEMHGLVQAQQFQVMDAQVDHEARQYITPA